MTIAALGATVMIGCSNDAETTPMAPSPVDAGGVERKDVSGSTPAPTSMRGANRTIGPVDPSMPPADWDVDIVEDHVRQARPPRHSGIRFSISPSRVVAGTAFTVTATVPTGVVAANRSHSRYNAWVMEWYRLGYGQHVAKGTCAGGDSDWKTCEFTVPWDSTIAHDNGTRCPGAGTSDTTWEADWGIVFPAKCWDAKIILKTKRSTGTTGGAGTWNNVLCVGVHHPTETTYDRARVTGTRCDHVPVELDPRRMQRECQTHIRRVPWTRAP